MPGEVSIDKELYGTARNREPVEETAGQVREAEGPRNPFVIALRGREGEEWGVVGSAHGGRM